MTTKILHEAILPFSSYPIRVLFVNSLQDPDNCDESLYGCTDFDICAIKINVPMHTSIEQLLHTVLHELLHAYIYFTGHCHSLTSPAAEEAVVIMLEHQLFWLIDKQRLTQLLDLGKVKKYLRR